MQTKEALAAFICSMRECNTVAELMNLFQETEREHNLIAVFVFIADTPAQADAPSYLSLIDNNDNDGEEWTNSGVTRLAQAAAIRTGLTWDHPDLLLFYSAWMHPNDTRLAMLKRDIEENDSDEENAAKMLAALTAVTPYISIVK